MKLNQYKQKIIRRFKKVILITCQNGKRQRFWINNYDFWIESFQRMMNFHNNTTLTKVLHTLQDNQNTNNQSKQIYQSVLHKHFLIIQTFLQKINALYSKHEEFENKLATITEKLEKIDTNSKNIHYQFRSTHLKIDKRLNTMGADFTNLQEQLKNLKIQTPFQSYLSSSHFLAQSSQLKIRKKKQRRKQCSKDETYKVVVYSHEQINQTKGRNIEKMDKNCINLRNSCKNVQFERLSSHSSQKVNEPSESSNNKQSIHIQSYYQDSQQESENLVDQQWVREHIQCQLNKFSNYCAARMKELQIMILKNKEEIQTNFVKKQQFALLQKQLEQKLAQKNEELKKNIHQQNILLRQQVLALTKQNNVSLQTFQNGLKEKIDHAFFHQSITNLNAALNQQFKKIERFYTKKLQTKKAFDFLENKLNRFILEDNNMRSRKNMGINQNPHLKINKCQSHKKFDVISDKSIMDRMNKIEEGNQPLSKSFDTSLWQIQSLESSYNIGKEQKFYLKPMLSNSGKFKTCNSSTAAFQIKQKDISKTGKSLSTSKKQAGLTLMITKAQPKVNIKQWRDKVVKILSKQGIKKRKVTFR